MKDITIPRCFWEIDAVDYDCECKKVYVDLTVDFEPIRVYMCKDWYIFEIKRLMDGKDKGHDNYKHNVWGSGLKYAQELLYRTIIDEYIGRPITDRLIIDTPSHPIDRVHWSSNFLTPQKTGNISDVKMNLVICERPFFCESISALKFIQYVHTTGEKEALRLEQMYRTAISIIFEWLESKIGYQKYSKYRKILQRLKGEFYLGEPHILRLNELMIELINISLKKN